jgi:RND family efflux transporter MFP subunit
MMPLFLHCEEEKMRMEELHREAARHQAASLIRRDQPRKGGNMRVWKILGLGLLALLVIWGGFAIFGKLTKSEAALLKGGGQVMEAKRGNLKVTVSANGSVVAPGQAKLSFESAGTISALSVEVGDSVSKGQALASLDTSSLERAVAQAEANLKSAQLSLEKARKPYDETDFARAEAAVAQAEAALKSAKHNLEKVQDSYDAEMAVLSARAALKTAEDSLKNARELYDENGIADAEAAVRSAEATLEKARQDLIIVRETHAKALRDAQKTLSAEEEDYIDLLEAHYGNILSGEHIYESLKVQTGREEWLVPQVVKDAYNALLDTKNDLNIANAQAAKAIADAENSVFQAENALRNARKDLADRLNGTDAILIQIREIQVENAQAVLNRAQRDLLALKDGPDLLDVKIQQNQVASAQAALGKAQADLADMKAGPDPLDIELMENQVSNAQIALAEARERLEKATIVAPFDGLVANINNKVGDMVGAGSVVIHLIDPGEFEVEASVDELDVNQVEVGQLVQISLDAIPETVLEGRVKAIAPVAQTKPGVKSYKTIISLEPRGRVALKDGMTASIDIVVASRQNVLMVPSRAISQSGGTSIVVVMVDGKPQERVVHTGISQEGQTEILSGLSDGEKVVVGAVRD